MSGDRDNPDRDFICQSNPRTACEMSASRPGEQVFAHLYVYYHPAAIETLYTGLDSCRIFRRRRGGAGNQTQNQREAE